LCITGLRCCSAFARNHLYLNGESLTVQLPYCLKVYSTREPHASLHLEVTYGCHTEVDTVSVSFKQRLSIVIMFPK